MRHRNIAPLLGLWYGFLDNYSRLPGLVSPWFEEGNLLEYIHADSESHAKESTGKHTPIKTRLFWVSSPLSSAIRLY